MAIHFSPLGGANIYLGPILLTLIALVSTQYTSPIILNKFDLNSMGPSGAVQAVHCSRVTQ